MFALPPSQNKITVADVVELDTRDHKGLYRIDRVEESGLRLVEATRVDPEVYLAQELYEEGAVLQAYVGPTPVEMLFLDLPLLTGDEAPHEPYIAATARPWPGSVALYSSAVDSNYVLHDVLRQRAIVGQLTTPLLRGPLGIWDRQAGVEVRLVSGTSHRPRTSPCLLGPIRLRWGMARPITGRSFNLRRLHQRERGSSRLERGSSRLVSCCAGRRGRL